MDKGLSMSFTGQRMCMYMWKRFVAVEEGCTVMQGQGQNARDTAVILGVSWVLDLVLGSIAGNARGRLKTNRYL